MIPRPTDLHRLPKVVLHDHLDGGLRAGTVLALAAVAGHALPADDEVELARWFHRGGRAGSLPAYLAPFEHTVAVLQTRAALRRVARECAEDLAADGVVYAEVRYAPELSTVGGLELDEVLAALADGLGEVAADVEVRLLVCAMRDRDRSGDVVDAAVRARDAGLPVAGVDLAGPEAGFPAAGHALALRRAAEAGLGITLHAGEEAGPGSVADALDQGATRLGHGVRVIEDVTGGVPGPVARRVLERRVTLEVCPTSNVHTGVVASPAEHPVDRLAALGFGVTVSPDNRLMSGVSTSDELAGLVATFGWGAARIAAVQREAVRAAFVADEDARARLATRVEDGLAALLGEAGVSGRDDGPGG